ncbi:MAG: hypothetical protein P3W95_002860, partial [Tepidimonas taiwanensis]|nr:hypothetical protein [Tepidimonas taiwanensis]
DPPTPRAPPTTGEPPAPPPAHTQNLPTYNAAVGQLDTSTLHHPALLLMSASADACINTKALALLLVVAQFRTGDAAAAAPVVAPVRAGAAALLPS